MNGVELDKNTRLPFGAAPVVANPVVTTEEVAPTETSRINQSFSGNGLSYTNNKFMPLNPNPVFKPFKK